MSWTRPPRPHGGGCRRATRSASEVTSPLAGEVEIRVSEFRVRGLSPLGKLPVACAARRSRCDFQTAGDVTKPSRGTKCPSDASFRVPLKFRGRGECRAPDAPDSRVCNIIGKTHTR